MWPILLQVHRAQAALQAFTVHTRENQCLPNWQILAKSTVMNHVLLTNIDSQGEASVQSVRI